MSSEAVDSESFPVKSEEEKKKNFVLLLKLIMVRNVKRIYFVLENLSYLMCGLPPQTKIAYSIAP